jgi:hypothetical protein
MVRELPRQFDVKQVRPVSGPTSPDGIAHPAGSARHAMVTTGVRREIDH